MKSVSIILTTYNRLDYLKTVLPHYRKVTKYPNYKLIIADDCSTDGTQEWLKEIQNQTYQYELEDGSLSSPVKYFDGLFLSTANLGVTNSRNQGIVRNKADYYVLVDDDTMHKKGWLTEAVSILDTHQNIGAVTTQRPLYELLEKPEILSALDKYLLIKNDVKVMITEYLGSCIVFSDKIWNKIGATSHTEKRSGICRYSNRITRAGYLVGRTLPAFSESIDMPQHELSLRFGKYKDSYTAKVAPESMQKLEHYTHGIKQCINFDSKHYINDLGQVVEKP